MTMTTMPEEEHRWGQVLRLLYHTVRKAARRRAGRGLSPVDLWTDDPSLREAVCSVRMAANPGEDYDEVAARLKTEAAKYKAFLRNPTPIGEITLSAKRIGPDARGDEVSGRMYQVRDPAKGRASMLYSFERSEHLVFEFIVHDQHNVQLFPIARTYSTWFGKKTFNLGDGRTFELNMVADGSPDVVRVEACFTTDRDCPADGPETCAMSGGLPLAADSPNSSSTFTEPTLSPPVRWRRITSQAIASCLVLMFCAGFVWWKVTPGGPDEASVVPLARTALPITHTPPDAGAPPRAADGFQLGFASIGSTDEGRARGYVTLSPDSVGGTPAKNRRVRKVARIVAVDGGRSVSMDDGFCHRAGELCDKWRAGLQNAIDAVSNLLALPTDTAVGAGQFPEGVWVSYTTDGHNLRQVRVTLLAGDAFLLIRETGCVEFGGSGERRFAETLPAVFTTAESVKCGAGVSNVQGGGNYAVLTEKEVEPVNTK